MTIRPRLHFAPIETAQEALVLPGVDVLTGLTLGSAPAGGHVNVDLGDDHLSYDYNPDTWTFHGQANGTEFTLQATPGTSGPNQLTLTGQIGDNDFQETQENLADGSVHIHGKAGQVDFDETFTPDPMYGITPHYGSVSGTVAGLPYTVDITHHLYDSGLDQIGKLDDQEVKETFYSNAYGNFICGGGNLAGQDLHQTIQL